MNVCCPRRARVIVGALALLHVICAGAQETTEGFGDDFGFADDSPFGDVPAQPEEEKSVWRELWDETTISGYLKNETAYRYREPRSITKIRNIFYLNAQYPPTENTNFNFTGWAYYDLAYDLFDYDTIAARDERRSPGEPLVFVERLDEEKDSPVADIRELYMDFFLEGADVRLGKQYIIWGVLEGVRVVDEINPMDFRELILPDLLDYRIPLWSAKLDYFGEKANYQFVWIPDLRFHKPAPRGSEWELLQDVCKGQPEDILCIDSEPDSWRLEDSEVGFKVDTYWWDTELSFSYFYTWDDFPVIYRSIPIDTNRFCNEGLTDEENEGCVNPSFFPTYTRIHMLGSTAVKQMGRYILKGEFAYVLDKYFGTKNTVDEDGDGFLDSDGVLQKDHIRWGLGVEFNVLGMDIAPGITQWIILDYDRALMQDKFDTSVNLFVRKEFPAQAAVFQMLVIHLVNLEEVLAKPKVTFQIDDHLQFSVGLDLFDGKKSDFGLGSAQQSSSSGFVPGIAQAQFLGNFHDNDRIYFEFKYSF